jgi:transcriptional regulator with XRE-family HTH domain
MINDVGQRFISLFEMLEVNGLITSRADAARRLNYKPQAFTEVLKGRTNISIELVQKFCTEYGANPDYLILGTGEYFSNRNTHLNAPLLSKKNAPQYKKNVEQNVEDNVEKQDSDTSQKIQTSFKQSLKTDNPPGCPQCLEKDKKLEEQENKIKELHRAISNQADYIDSLKEKIEELTGRDNGGQKRKAS